MLVVLDTNVLLSGIAYPSSVPGRIIEAWRGGSIDLVASTYLLDELRRVMPRLRKRHGLSAQEIDDFVDILALNVQLFDDDPGIAEKDLRDRNDLPILATLIASGAEYLITGDKDLLALSNRYPVLTPREFWDAHAGIAPSEADAAVAIPARTPRPR